MNEGYQGFCKANQNRVTTSILTGCTNNDCHGPCWAVYKPLRYHGNTFKVTVDHYEVRWLAQNVFWVPMVEDDT